MSLPKDYLEYPRRRHGMDQEWYGWRHHFELPVQPWPNDAQVAVWFCTALEFFPLNPAGKPFKAPGSMVTPYPDLRHYTTRDYGNRVAVYRILRLFAEHGVRGSFAVNSAVAERYPTLLRDVVAGGHEIVAHGVDMDRLHYGGLEEAVEAAQVDESLGVLRRLSGQPVEGWLSPARSESPHTLRLLTARGVRWVCDFVNDELPFELDTGAGRLYALPHSYELSDRQILIDYHHSSDEYVEQVLDQYEWLVREAETHGRRILSLPLTPYIVGLPYRVQALREIVETLARDRRVWFATGAELLAGWRAGDAGPPADAGVGRSAV